MRSLSNSPAFVAFVVDQLSELGEVEPKAMFGGIGLYHRSMFFGIVAHETLYLKTDEANRGAYAKRRMAPFRPYAEERRGRSSYYAVPLDVLESAPALAEWARAAVGAARRR